jgi:hypothetical protein
MLSDRSSEANEEHRSQWEGAPRCWWIGHTDERCGLYAASRDAKNPINITVPNNQYHTPTLGAVRSLSIWPTSMGLPR